MMTYLIYSRLGFNSQHHICCLYLKAKNKPWAQQGIAPTPHPPPTRKKMSIDPSCQELKVPRPYGTEKSSWYFDIRSFSQARLILFLYLVFIQLSLRFQHDVYLQSYPYGFGTFEASSKQKIWFWSSFLSLTFVPMQQILFLQLHPLYICDSTGRSQW